MLPGERHVGERAHQHAELAALGLGDLPHDVPLGGEPLSAAEKEVLRRCAAPVVAVTPIIGGHALKGSAAKMMRELGRDVSARSVAMEYLRIIDGFVIDEADVELVEGIRASGIQVTSAKTIMRTVDDRIALARTVLDFALSVREAKELEEEG